MSCAKCWSAWPEGEALGLILATPPNPPAVLLRPHVILESCRVEATSGESRTVGRRRGLVPSRKLRPRHPARRVAALRAARRRQRAPAARSAGRDERARHVLRSRVGGRAAPRAGAGHRARRARDRESRLVAHPDPHVGRGGFFRRGLALADSARAVERAAGDRLSGADLLRDPTQPVGAAAAAARGLPLRLIDLPGVARPLWHSRRADRDPPPRGRHLGGSAFGDGARRGAATRGRRRDRKSTRLNSSHGYISYAVFCLKKKKKKFKKVSLTTVAVV